jgi:hypothetical protein
VKGVVLSREGIHTSGNFVGGKAVDTVIPFASIRKRRMDDFKLRLGSDAPGTSSELVIDCSEEGFFPGLGLLERLAPA